MSIKAVVIPVSLDDKPYLTDIEDYKSYYPIIGCRAFDVVSLYGESDVSVDCYIDDEGLLNESPVNSYFKRAYDKGVVRYPLYGIGVITLTDLDTGDSIDLDLNFVKKVLRDYGFTDSDLSHLVYKP